MTARARSIGRPSVAALAAIGVLVLTGSAGPPSRTDPVPRRHVVEIRGMAFHPQALEVHVGDTVVWVNRDLVPHTATSSQDAEWNTGPLEQGKSGVYVPSHAGEAPYFCQLHPVMLGRLIVR